MFFYSKPAAGGGLVYVPRGFNSGSPSNGDFNKADFTIDGAYHLLDLSAIVPVDAKLVHFVCYLTNTTFGAFRLQQWNVANRNEFTMNPQVAGKQAGFTCLSQLRDAINQDIYYKADGAEGNWSQITVSVSGWFV